MLKQKLRQTTNDNHWNTDFWFGKAREKSDRTSIKENISNYFFKSQSTNPRKFAISEI